MNLSLGGIQRTLATLEFAGYTVITTNKIPRSDHVYCLLCYRFLKAAGGYDDWPIGRGIFHTPDKKFLVWVNEEDHLRLISMQKGGNLQEVYGRLVTVSTR